MMRKQLGLITSLIFLCATALCWAGCSNYNARYDNDCVECVETVCPEPCDPCGPRAPMTRGNFNEICCDGVIVTATQPKLCILGDNYAMDLCVKACIDVCSVEVHAMLPDGVTLVRSEPEGATTEDNNIVWKFDAMKRGEVRHSRVTMRADREGDLCVCFCVTAVPVQFCTVLCAKPILECTKCGPEEVCPGDAVPYRITVTNRGSCAAEDVIVTDNVPEGLEHSSGLRTLTFKLGNIEPCQTKRVNVCFTAVKRGKVCNTINVTSCNATPTSCSFCTNVCKECIELTKVGPKEVQIGKNADYQITVTNPGDKSLTEVILCDQAPSLTSIVEAEGAQVNGNQAVWRFSELKPGEKQTVVLTLTTCTAGYFVNRVCVDNCQDCRACAEWGTRWRGHPAINACFLDSEDPICIGEENLYTLRVTNQGSEEDSNVSVSINFSKELTPVTAYGDSAGTVSGQTVTFAPIQRLGARQTVEFKVRAIAKESGDGRIHASISSDAIKTPIVQQESTIVN